jgi:hypothetical protein
MLNMKNVFGTLTLRKEFTKTSLGVGETGAIWDTFFSLRCQFFK